jgi:hypothetical protein
MMSLLSISTTAATILRFPSSILSATAALCLKLSCGAWMAAVMSSIRSNSQS